MASRDEVLMEKLEAAGAGVQYFCVIGWLNTDGSYKSVNGYYRAGHGVRVRCAWWLGDVACASDFWATWGRVHDVTNGHAPEMELISGWCSCLECSLARPEDCTSV